MAAVGAYMDQYPSERGIEHNYLCLQLDKTLDIMEHHPSYRGPIVEELKDGFNPAFEPSVSTITDHEVIVTELLIFSRTIRTSSFASIHDLAIELEAISSKLGDLRLHREAINAIKIAIQLFRNLVAGGMNLYLSNLAHALKNLSIQLQNIGECEDALLASEDAIAIMRIVVATLPDHDFRPNLALTLRGYGDALVLDGRMNQCLPVLGESVALYAELIEEIENGTRTGTFTIFYSAANACLSQSSALFYEGEYLGAFEALNSALLYQSFISKNDLLNHFLWGFPERLFKHLYRVLSALYREGAPISLLGDAVTLYQKLTHTDPLTYSEQFLRCLYAYASISNVASLTTDLFVLHAFQSFILQLAFETDVVHSNVDHWMGANNYKRLIGRLQGSQEGDLVMKRAIEVYLSPDAACKFNTPVLANNVHQMMVSFSALHAEEAISMVQHTLDGLDREWNIDQVSCQDLLTSVLKLLLDTSERLDVAAKPRIIQQAERALQISRARSQSSDIATAYIDYGHTLVRCGEVDAGVAAIEDGIAQHRALFPSNELARSDLVMHLAYLCPILESIGRTLQAINVYRQIISAYADSADLSQSDSTKGSLAATLVRVAAYLMATGGDCEPFAALAHQLLSNTSTVLPFPRASLYALLIQCLLYSGQLSRADIATDSFCTKVSVGLHGCLTYAFTLEDQFKTHEALIHLHALQNDAVRIDDVVQKAYVVYKEHMGGEPSLAGLGLRHDTLAIIAFSYACLGRWENVLPFANAAVVTSGSHPRHPRNDMCYLENMCDLAARLWNSDRQDDALLLLENMAEVWGSDVVDKQSDGEGTGTTMRDDVRGLVLEGELGSGLHAYVKKRFLSSRVRPSRLADHKDAEEISVLLKQITALVDRYTQMTTQNLDSSSPLADQDAPCPEYSASQTHNYTSSLPRESDAMSRSDESLCDGGASPLGETLEGPLHSSTQEIDDPIDEDDHITLVGYNMRASSVSSGIPIVESPLRSEGPVPHPTFDASHPSSSSELVSKTDPPVPLTTSLKHWVTLVANILIIAWTLVIAVVFVSRSLSLNVGSEFFVSVL